MSVSTEITRIQNARNKIRTKAVSMGIASATDNLTELATEIDDITVYDDSTHSITSQGTSYTIPEGYYVGSGNSVTASLGSAVGTVGGTSIAGSATAAISNVDNMRTTTKSGTAGTDYFEVKATATGTNGGYTPKYTVTTAGYIGTGDVTGSTATVTVNGDSTGTSLYIPKAVVETSANAIKTTTTGGGYIPNNTTIASLTTTSRTPGAGSITLTPGTGSVNATSSNVSITQESSQPSSGYYFTATGSGTVSGTGSGSVSTGSGYITSGTTSSNTASDSASSNTATKYYSVKSGSLNNEATSGVTYTEDTSSATIIPSGGSLYLNEGYYPNTEITLSHLIPDPSGTTNAGVSQILTGYSAYDGDGNEIVGTMAEVTPTFSGGVPSLTDTSNTITVSGMTASQTSTSYYIDAAASAKATRTALTYANNYTGYLDKTSGTSASAASTSSASTISATRVYIPAGSVDNVSSSGDATPTIEKQAITIVGVTDAANGSATTTTPSSGVYVAVKSPQITADITASVSGTAGYLPSGYTEEFTDNDAFTVNASATTYIPVKKLTLPSSTSSTSSGTLLTGGVINTSNATQYLNISSGYNTVASYYMIRPVTTNNITAANIKYGTVAQVGDADNSSRITSVTGTFTGENTIASGQSPAGTGQILSGYSAFINGAEVQGSIASNTGVSGTITGLGVVSGDTSYTIPAGYYSTAGTVSLTNDIETLLAAI